MEMELNTAQAEIGREKRVNQNFAERTCTGCTTVMRTQASSYHLRLNAVLGDLQVRGDHLRGFPVRLRED